MVGKPIEVSYYWESSSYVYPSQIYWYVWIRHFSGPDYCSFPVVVSVEIIRFILGMPDMKLSNCTCTV
ncbi:hypothetical protein I7I48_10324 [Histoplasma ohiense]|nr:hypothetical protein I7I48_10324 [Histoplasma ohiense (nom. inval.)]